MGTINPIAVFSRTATFELDCGDHAIYHSPALYRVVLNGRTVKTGDTNVFTLFGLDPGMLYQLRLEPEGGGGLLGECSFVTREESLFLDVTRFGARAGAKVDCTGALQAALDVCPPGGTVYVPPGVYLLYPVFLQSGVTLYLEKGAVLQGGTDRTRYPILPGMVPGGDGGETSFATWEGNPLDSHAALLTAVDKRDVLVTGEGTVDGNAQNGDWWQDAKRRRAAWRPRTVFCARCEGFTLQGITVQNSPSWTVHPYYSRGVDVLNLFIHNPPVSPNTDGCNPESCIDVRIMGTRISVGDDCIAVKSGKYYMSRRHPARTRNVLVRNCLLERGHGAVVVGSEISSGLDGLRVERCLVQNTDRGLRVKTRRGRGSKSVLRNIEFGHIHMRGVGHGFTVNMFYSCDPDGSSEYVRSKAPLPVDEKTPAIENLYCHDILCEDTHISGLFIYALPERPMHSLRLENVRIHFSKKDCTGLPVMMEGLAPVRKLALFAANLSALELKSVVFENHEGEAHRLENVGEFVIQ